MDIATFYHALLPYAILFRGEAMLKNTLLKTVAFKGKDSPVSRNPLDFETWCGSIAFVQGPAADSHNAGGRPAVIKMSGDGQVREPLPD